MSTRALLTITSAVIFFWVFFASDEPATGQTLRVTDVGLTSSFQDTTFGHYKRGRACIAADFDLDGYDDFYMGNPGDESYILRNVQGPGGRRFELGQVLVTGDLAWGGVAFDYDNDGDYDLFIACGGNEGIGFDYLFRNDWIKNGTPTGQLTFTDVTSVAGVAGIVPDGETDPIRTASGNAVIADYDRDGDTDIFVNGNFKFLTGHPELEGRNTLWRNNSDGTFTDVTVASGLGTYRAPTRHSTFFDYDNDGDPDLYENVFNGCNVLWRNNGDGTFSDVTAPMSAPGEDLSEPWRSFASASGDFNNDGWEDLMVFMRGPDDGAPQRAGPGDPPGYDCGCNECYSAPPTRVGCNEIEEYGDGHLLFLNREGALFKNVGTAAGLNSGFIAENGVMGCQIGDLNYDAIPDVYVGNGGPDSGEHDRFYLSTGAFENDVPLYADVSSFVDFSAEIPSGYEVVYPYRTHGVAFIDYDNDGTIEIAVSNGGPASRPDSVREPDRLFKIDPPESAAYLKVRPVGNGVAVSMDAIGTRVSIMVNDGETSRPIFKTLFGGSSFSAQNGFNLAFLLSARDSIESMTIKWPNGVVSTMTENLDLNTSIVVFYDALVTSAPDDPVRPEAFKVEQNYPNPFNPSTVIEFSLGTADHVTLKIYSMIGEEVITLVDEIQEPGRQLVSWDGTDSQGQKVASGMYLYKIKTSSSVEVRKMMLMK